MQKIYPVFKIITLLALTSYLTSCSSSSYFERYVRNKTKSSAETKKESTDYNSNLVIEDENELETTSVDYNQAEVILSKLDGVTVSNKKKERFLDEIISYLNTPYRYGGESRGGIDCSAFTQKVYGNSLNVPIPRTAREQYRKWQVFNDKDKLKFGDLVYFNTSKKYFPGHVGIYLDDDLFAHASSSRGVIVSSLNNIYYSSKFVGANRVKIKQ